MCEYTHPGAGFCTVLEDEMMNEALVKKKKSTDITEMWFEPMTFAMVNSFLFSTVFIHKPTRENVIKHDVNIFVKRWKQFRRIVKVFVQVHTLYAYFDCAHSKLAVVLWYSNAIFSTLQYFRWKFFSKLTQNLFLIIMNDIHCL